MTWKLGLKIGHFIWHQIQSARKEGRDLHVMFLDLANAFGSVPHNLLWTTFTCFGIPEAMANLVQAYFQVIQLFLSTEDFTAAWQPLEIGIMARCTISPLAFTMAMEVIIHASRWVVGGELMKADLRLSPIRAFMDDLTTHHHQGLHQASPGEAAGQHQVGLDER